MEELPATGLPLGILGSASTHEEPPARHLEVGDVLLLITDGVWEEKDPSGQRFGKDRLMKLFARVAGGCAQEIVDAIQGEVERFIEGTPRKDDFTLIAIKRVAGEDGVGCSP